MTRERDYAYEALAEVTSTDTDAGRGELNVALKSIRQQTPDLAELANSYELADEIHERAKMYRTVMGEDVLMTAPALAKHWKRVFEESTRHRPVRGTNLTTEKYEPLEEGKRGVGPPEWVRVWSWARATGQETRPFPQQDRYEDPTQALTMAEYEALRNAWVAAGSPHETVSV